MIFLAWLALTRGDFEVDGLTFAKYVKCVWCVDEIQGETEMLAGVINSKHT